MTKLNLASGIYTLRSFQNLDPILDPPWHFQDGLGQYPDNSIEAITESCGLTYLPLTAWPAAFAEFARVLEPGGIVRVQEEWADNPASQWYPNGYPGSGHDDAAVVLTTPQLVTDHMLAARLVPTTVTADTTTFRDRSLIQRFHNGEPHSFAIEGRKPST